MFDFSHEPGFGEKHFQLQKQQMSPEVKCPAMQEKSENFQLDLDVKCIAVPCSSDFGLDLAQHNIKLCNCKPSDVSSDLSALDKMRRELVSREQELDSRSKTENPAVPSSNDVALCRSCRDIEQQCLVRPVRPRSLEVTKDIRIDIQGHRYENVEHFLRIPPRAASGSCLDIDVGKNEDVESQASSSTTVTTAVGQMTSSASVDTAISRAAHVCKCNDVDLISYQLMHNSVELDSAAKSPDGVSERRFRQSPGANQTAHCSRKPGEVLLLSDELLKFCSRHTYSVSLPIDIVSARRLPPDQKISNPLASAVNTSTASHGHELQPTCSAYSMLPAAETKAMRKRAYRVGLNLFNR